MGLIDILILVIGIVVIVAGARSVQARAYVWGVVLIVVGAILALYALGVGF